MELSDAALVIMGLAPPRSGESRIEGAAAKSLVQQLLTSHVQLIDVDLKLPLERQYTVYSDSGDLLLSIDRYERGVYQVARIYFRFEDDPLHTATPLFK